MAAEARRIKMSAEYQSQIQQTIERMASPEIVGESDHDDDDTSAHSEPPWVENILRKKIPPKMPYSQRDLR